ncbi:MAG: glutamate--tRNA ligase [Acidimicrobiia bacterium]|nr:glutamate--tRNA ligase [Acidimicrobiia bacterium]
MADSVRVRFAPAPTGYLHVGGTRTALYNWLFARHHGGTFLLRIEDTDVARSHPEWAEGIQSALRWLGLDWDEEPVLQSTRFDRYREAADRLLAEGRAYECYCTEEEVRARNDAALAQGRTPGYDGRCRDLSPGQRAALAAEGRPRSVRFRTPDEGVSTFFDLVRGEVTVEWSTVHDFVVLRATGAPVFFLANAVDDAEMGITHVIRGEDLLDSTHRVLALRSALGLGRPDYAHLPLLVGADRAKLSKRHGAVAIEDFRDRGYLPEALFNYLALLGWSPEDGRELHSRDELVAAFDLDRVTHSAAFFDHQKLDWMNGEYLRALSLDDLVRRASARARERFGERLDEDVLRGALRIGQERAVTLEALLDQTEFLFVDERDFEIAPDSWERLAGTERVAEVLDAVAGHLETCDWTAEAIDLRPVLEPLGVKPRKALPAVYAAVEGRHAGLPLFDSIELLGRERALRRVRAARERLE